MKHYSKLLLFVSLLWIANISYAENRSLPQKQVAEHNAGIKKDRVKQSVYDGNGTPDSPFIIKSASDLMNLATTVNGGNSCAGNYFELADNIDMQGQAFAGIGTEATPFSGTFDGKGFSISGISVKKDSYAGFFGRIDGATINDVRLNELQVEGEQNIGGIAGGSVNSTITNCSTSGSTSGVISVGALVGNSGEGTVIQNCYSSMQHARYETLGDIGGLVGYNCGKIENCYYSGTISARIYRANTTGGIVGYNHSTGYIHNCYFLKYAGVMNSDFDYCGSLNWGDCSNVETMDLTGTTSSGKRLSDVLNRWVSENSSEGNYRMWTQSNYPEFGDYKVEKNGPYNPYLQSRVTGYSYTTFTGYKYAFNLVNNGDESIVVTKCTLWNSSTWACLTSTTDESLLGELAPNETMELACSSYEELISSDFTFALVMEWEYIYKGETYTFCSWKEYPLLAENIILDKTSLQLNPNENVQLVATVLPEKTTNKAVTWSSSNTDVATVDQQGNVTAVDEGIAVITVSSTDGSNLSASCEVVVKKVAVREIIVDKNEVVIEKGRSVIVGANVLPENAYNKNLVWKSENESVAMVNLSGEFYAVGEGETTVTVTSMSNPEVAAVVSVKVTPVLVTDIALNYSSYRMERGESFQLIATVSPETAGDKHTEWTTSDEKVVVVDQQGNVSAVGVGNAIITATTTDGSNKSASCEVTVDEISVKNILLDTESVVLEIGESVKVEATAVPDDAGNKKLLWVSDDEKVASVSSFGEIVAIGEGQTVIRVSAESNPDVSAVISVEVVPIHVKNIVLDCSSYSLEKGESFQLVASVSPENAANKQVKWISSAKSIASVDQNGNVTALSVGTAVITAIATDGSDISASCEVVVNPVSVKEIQVERGELALEIGESTTIGTTIIPENADNKKLLWTSSNEDVVMVNSSGKVVGISEGEAIISVSSESNPDVFATINIKIIPILVKSIELNYSTYVLNKGNNVQLLATLLPENAPNKEVKWTTSDENVVMVSSAGRCVYMGDGCATITATTCDGSNLSAMCVFECANGIIAVANDNSDLKFYTIDGRHANRVQNGVNIICTEDGQTVKMMKK